MALGVLLHNLVLLGGVAWEPWLGYVLAVEIYSLLSWALLRRFYSRGRDWVALAFLIADFFPLTAAVYLTGATKSWIFFILLFRVVDQAGSTLRRVLLFAHVAPLAYVALVAWSDAVGGSPVQWDVELLKTAFLYLAALYAASTARATERQRARTVESVRVARDLIGQLRQHQDTLVERTLEVQLARAVAEKASEARAEILSRASHELRTPLNHVLGFAQLLELTDLTEEQASNLQEVLRAARDLLQMVDEMLQITDLQTGHADVTLQAVPVKDLLRGVLAETAAEASRQRVRLPADLPDSCDRMVLADPGRLRQVFLELLSNAITYNSDEGRVEISCRPVPGERLRISVTDTGMGLPQDRMYDVFLPFERLGAERMGSVKGAGLGLAVVKALVTAMDGEIGVHSRPGSGSTFWVELPLAVEDYTPAEPWT